MAVVMLERGGKDVYSFFDYSGVITSIAVCRAGYESAV